ncbi:ComF family protein [Xanthobacter sp. TB0139]|uniref:ComF family protein n=1 Tax=Xanthobacter sp. TB0139 TaxID=3459178 RepID=UPI0040395CB0
MPAEGRVPEAPDRKRRGLAEILRLWRQARLPGWGAIRLGRTFLDLALPPTCTVCGRVMAETGGLCPSCWRELHFITPPVCQRTGEPLTGRDGMAAELLSTRALAEPPAFDSARAAVLFNEMAQRMVHGLKYADRLDMARPMARLMVQAGLSLLREADMMVPVPLHPARLWRRRFNQAAVLARSIQSLLEDGGLSLPVRTDLLRRRRMTRSQTRLSKAQRRANMEGAFIVPQAAWAGLEGRTVLLVDDVYTTGATLDACVRALRKSGARRVDVLTFAHVPDVEFTAPVSSSLGE